MSRVTRAEAQRLLAVRRELMEADTRVRPKGRALTHDGIRQAYDTLRTLDQRDNLSLEETEAVDRARTIVRGVGKMRAAFWNELGAPPICDPGDTATARLYHRRIMTLVDRGGWTHSERTQLTELEKVWGKRARGEDMRFLFAGNRPGRLDKQTEKQIRILEGRPIKGDADDGEW